MNRLKEWQEFSKQVETHITNYANIQYGNPGGDEQIDSFSLEDCWQNMQRYYNRRNSSVRGKTETQRDVLKVAHYAQVIYTKMKEQFLQGDIYK